MTDTILSFETQWKHDMDIPLNSWQSYLKKYKDKYLLEHNELGIWQIRLKRNLGFIQPYSIINKKLVAVLDFKTPNALTFFLKRAQGFDVKTSQRGDLDLCIVFDEKNIKSVENLFKIRKKYKLSKKEREKRVKRIKKARMVKNGVA